MKKKFFKLTGMIVFMAYAFFSCRTEPLPKVDRVIISTIDNLRAEHLVCYGYLRNTSPFINKLAKKSTIFFRAYCPMPTTAPSLNSLSNFLFFLGLPILKPPSLILCQTLRCVHYFGGRSENKK